MPAFAKEMVLRETESACWIPMSHKHRTHNGYVNITIDNKQFRLHRLMFQHFYGPIPKGLLICHTCDNPACQNPEHLFLGTEKDNSQDMVTKERSMKGRGQKLTKEDVGFIRWMLHCHLPQKEIAEVFGIHPGTVSKINRRTRWT